MEMLQLWATILLLVGLSEYTRASSCNGQARELIDIGRRGPSYVITSSSEPAISDSTLPAGWYIAKDSAGVYTLVNGTAPKYAYCGTDNPIYVIDMPVKLQEGKEYPLIACLVDFDSSCKYHYNIKVRKCGREIQYYLIPTDGTSAYCFEPSSISLVEPAPNYTIPGNIQVSVALMYRHAKLSLEPELDFKCNFGRASNLYYYGVSWAINGRVNKEFVPVKIDKADSTNINETILRSLGFNFGFSLQCAVRVASTTTGNQTVPQMSDTFYAGIKVLTPQIKLSSGSRGRISLQPTIPLGCRRADAFPSDRQEPCAIDIEMFDPNSKYQCKDTIVTALDNQKLCGSTLTGWRNTTSQYCIHQHNVNYCSYNRIKQRLPTFSMDITVSNDRLQYPKDKTFTVQLKTADIGPHQFWENATVDHVTVIYTGGSENLEWRNNKCSLINDPILNTFDRGFRYYIKSFAHFLLYKDKTYHTEVQIESRTCDADRSASCTCAVAIQAGGDVFVINICNKVKRASFVHCRGNVLNVREINSNNYEIYLPTGTKIQIHMKRWSRSNFLNVYIYPSPSDVRNTEGLCGNLNGIPDEIVNSTYVRKWQLQDSLINKVPPNLPPTWTYDHNVCLCPNETSSATQNGQKDSRAICFSQQYATCTENIQLTGEKKSCTIINKRSIERHRRNVERLLALSLSSENSKSRVRKSTTNSHLTEEQAYRECLDVFKSKPTYNMISDLPNIALNDSLSACVNDMMVDGQDFWKEESYNSWVSVVTQEIGRNGTFRKEKSEVVGKFKSVTCPSQCNGNGNCINGTCVCKDDYVGDSCFVKKSAPLELTDIEGGGECDLADGDDCHDCLQFHTENLLKGFKCRIDTADLDVNGTVTYSEKHDHSGEYESVFDGYCCPSAVEKRRKKRDVTSNTFTVRYSVSISNDGVHYGPSRTVYVFDSTCQSYVVMPTGDLLFSLKTGTCYIDGQCYRDGDRSLMSPFFICCPFVTSYQWTNRQDCVPPTSNQEKGGESSKFEIVAVSVSVSGILIVACVVVFAIWTYKSKKRTVSTTGEKPPKYPDYTELDFSNQPYNKKFQSGGKATFQPGHIDVFTTDYSQQRKYDTNTRKYEQNTE